MTVIEKCSRLLFGALLILLFSACETDFDLEGEWKDIPVVYAFFSTQDTAHYVRVERAFLEPGGDARAIAQIPDSIFYRADQAVVRLQIGSNDYVLERVDGAAEGYPREEGDFANAPNILYKITQSDLNLESGDRIQLSVDRGGDTEPAFAETTVLFPLEMANLPLTGSLNFSDYNRITRVEWRATGDFAQVFDVRMIIRYRETNPDNPSELLDKELEWVLDQTAERDPTLSLQNIFVQNEAFYQYLASRLDPLEEGVRKFTAIDYQVTGSGQEIADYLTIANANIGITSSQAIPQYTNIEGGLGILSSRYQARFEGLNLSPDSRDSLYDGIHTRELRFVP